MTLVRSFDQNSSTSDGISKSSLTSGCPFWTSRFWTSTVSDGAAEERRGIAPDDVGKAVGRFLDEQAHVRRRQRLCLSADRASFCSLYSPIAACPAGDRPATNFRTSSSTSSSVVPILAALPDVRKRLGELTHGARDASGIAAGDDQRALLAERFLHELNQPFARLQRRRLPFLVLAPTDRRSDATCRSSTRIGSPSGAVIVFAVFAIGSDDAGRLEAQARAEIDDAFRAVALGAEQNVDAIGNQVVVGVGERAVVGVEGREIEVLLRAAARAPRRRLRCGGGRIGARPRAAGRPRRRPCRARASGPAPSGCWRTTARGSASRALVALN